MTDTRALVVLDEPETDRHLLERARSFAAGADREVVVVAIVTPGAYEEGAAALDAIGEIERTTFDERAFLDGVASEVEALADEVLGDAVDHDHRTAVVESDDQAAAILDLADETGCDHVFLAGERRSPTGKAVFGDRTQQVILEFDGYVTVRTDR